MIKRYFKNGRVFPSVTETLASKKAAEPTEEKDIAKSMITKVMPPLPSAVIPESDERTCNSCISREFVLLCY